MKIVNLLVRGVPLILISTAGFSVPLYSIQELGTFGGGDSYATAINALGVVAGYSTNLESKRRPFIFDGIEIKEPKAFGSYPQEIHEAIPYDINDEGDIAGKAYTRTNWTSVQGFRLDNGSLKLFRGSGSGGRGGSSAFGINNVDQVVGSYSNYLSGSYGFVDDNVTYQRVLHPEVNSVNNSPQAVNDHGHMTGSYDLDRYNPGKQAFIYANQKWEGIGTLGGRTSTGRDINDLGTVVGESYINAEFDEHAFIYLDNKIQDLGTLGGTNSKANAVNEENTVVGSSETLESVDHAFVYEDGQLYDLNLLISPDDPLFGNVVLKSGEDINDSDQIVGHMIVDGKSRGFIATPIPGTDNPQSDTDISGTYRVKTSIAFESDMFLVPSVLGGGQGTRIKYDETPDVAEWEFQKVNNEYLIRYNSDDENQVCMGSVGWSAEPIIFNCNSSDTRQLWEVIEVGERYQLKNTETKRCLNQAASPYSGVTPNFELCVRAEQQTFYLETVDTGIDDGNGDANAEAKIKGNGELLPKNGSGLKVGWKTHRAGSEVSLVSSENTGAWYFSFDPHSDNYLIQSKSIGEARCLALPSWSNSLPILNRCDNGDRQKWNIEGSESEGYSLMNTETGDCLSRIDNSDNKLRVRECNGAALQLFNVE